MTEWTELNYAVVDVEGNGQQPPDLVELAIVKIEKGIIKEPMSWLIKPDQPIRSFATKIHGIKNKDVEDAPSFSTIKTEVFQLLDGSPFVAHNAHIDIGALQTKMKDWEPGEVFDTLKLARRLRPGLKSYSLGALVKSFSLADGLTSELTPHRAVYDAIVAARLFVLLMTNGSGAPYSIEKAREILARGGTQNETPSLF